MGKQIIFKEELRKRLKEAAEDIHETVGSTFGPSGMTVIYEGEHGYPLVIRDGVTVARMISYSDPVKDIAAQMIKKAAQKADNNAGDGTTTTVVILHAILQRAFDYMSKTFNVNEMHEGMLMAQEMLSNSLYEGATKVTSKEQIKNIAQISTNYDDEAVRVVLEAWNYSGEHGAIKTETSKTGKTYTKNVKGVQLNSGFLDPYFINRKNGDICHLEDGVYVFSTEKKITSPHEIAPVIEYVHEVKRKSILIICQDMDPHVVEFLLKNNVKAGLRSCAIKVPEFGSQQRKNLDDISVVTNGTVFYEKSHNLEDLQGKDDAYYEEILGFAKEVVCNDLSTLIIDGAGSEEALNEHKALLAEKLKEIQDDYEKEQVKSRIARISEGVSVVYVGGYNEIQINELRLRIEDALQAVKATTEKGYIEGAGLPLLVLSREYLSLAEQNKIKSLKGKPDTFVTGFKILMEAVQKPFEKIIDNTGESWVDIRNKVTLQEGYDAKNKKFVNLKEAGIIDPVKVTVSSLENAVSIASLMMKSGSIIVEEKSDNSWKESYRITE